MLIRNGSLVLGIDHLEGGLVIEIAKVDDEWQLLVGGTILVDPADCRQSACAGDDLQTRRVGPRNPLDRRHLLACWGD